MYCCTSGVASVSSSSSSSLVTIDQPSPLCPGSSFIEALDCHFFNSLSVFDPSFLHVLSPQHHPPPAQPRQVFKPHAHMVVPTSVISSFIVKVFTVVERASIPFRLASNGLMSKTSMPCILPRISNRSRPVDCSRSVGTVPGSAPGGRRSSYVLTSAQGRRASACFYDWREGRGCPLSSGWRVIGVEGVCMTTRASAKGGYWEKIGKTSGTFERNHFPRRLAWFWISIVRCSCSWQWN